jgi:3-deoxy-D-manno-octulosonic-acid transferase
MRLFYSLMWWLALPLVLTRLWLRGRKEPATASTGASASASIGATPRRAGAAPPVLWVHAVSVGETRAAEPLVDALLAEYPQSRIILTHMTPTGRATGKALFARHGERLVQSYLPYDTGSMVSRFIRHFRGLHPDGDGSLAQPDRRLQCAQSAGGAGQRPPVRTFAAQSHAPDRCC